MAEMSAEQFELVATLLQSKEPAKTAARLVLTENKSVTEAALAAGVLQPSVSRLVKRCRETHRKLEQAYGKLS